MKTSQALTDLDGKITFDTDTRLKDSYMNDCHHKADTKKLKEDFSTDDMILNQMTSFSNKKGRRKEEIPMTQRVNTMFLLKRPELQQRKGKETQTASYCLRSPSLFTGRIRTDDAIDSVCKS